MGPPVAANMVSVHFRLRTALSNEACVSSANAQTSRNRTNNEEDDDNRSHEKKTKEDHIREGRATTMATATAATSKTNNDHHQHHQHHQQQHRQ